MISELVWEWLSHDFQILRTGNISEKGYSKASTSSTLPLTLLPVPKLSRQFHVPIRFYIEINKLLLIKTSKADILKSK